MHQIFGAETLAFRPRRKRRSLNWWLEKAIMDGCRVSRLCGGKLGKSIEELRSTCCRWMQRQAGFDWDYPLDKSAFSVLRSGH